MEETRISRMYLNLLKRALGTTGAKIAEGRWLRSSVTWVVLVVLLLVAAGVAVHEKGRGDLTRIKTQLGSPAPVAEVESPEPGGLAPIVLTRTQHTSRPEFVSATLLPGRGMNVFQITAFIPGKGVVPLLASPALADAARLMTGAGDDANGQASLANGAAIELPWAGRILGASLPGGLSIVSNWHGRDLTLPVNWTGANSQGAEGGLLLRTPATSSTPSVMPDGGVAESTFDGGDFNNHWPSKTEVKTTAVLSARTLDLTVTARNAGAEPEPMGIGWRPRFAIVGGDRARVRLRLPSVTRAETRSAADAVPTGRLIPVEHTAFDLSRPEGSLLGDSLDALYVHLKTGILANNPEVELRDDAAGYGLRMTLLTSTIKAIHIGAPANAGYIGIDAQTNYDDPWGREWPRDEDTGMVVLQPQQSLQWKVRLELFPLTTPSGAIR